MEQRVNIKFYVKLGETSTEAHEMWQTVCDDEALSRSSEYKSFKPFKSGRDDHQNDPSSGLLSTTRNADTIANVREMVTRDRRLTLRRCRTN
jgi:hypothetical protein